MKMSKLLFLIPIIVALLYHPLASLSCGPWFKKAVFTYSLHPDFPLDNFAQGDLGVIQPTYARSYLYVAYRHLTGIGFDKDEQEALVSLWYDRLYYYRRSLPSGTFRRRYASLWGAEDQWSNVRNIVPKAGPAPRIETWRELPFYYYMNYLGDAFQTAAETLQDRIERFGAGSPEVLDWVRAQDMVFGNSSDAASIPEPAKPDAHPIIQADRAYQIAAANFYACNFDVAEKMFREIAADETSPWRQLASYLVARTLVRKATLSASPSGIDIDAATQAEAELKRVLSNDDLSSMHPAAQRLLNFVLFRLRPEERLREISQALLEKGLGEDLEICLSDYTMLLDKSFRGEDDLTDWIFTFQAQDNDALDHAFERWRETSSLPWLVASLSKVDEGDHRMTELLEAASRIDPGSPAFPSLAFHSIRLMIQSGRKGEARETLDSILRDSRIILPRSALNLFLTQRMEVAGDLDEFLKYAPRSPAGLVYGDMWAKMPESYAADTPNQPVLLDVGSAVVLDKYMPLTLLKEICTQDSFPLHLRRDLAIAVWVRSVLLDNQEISQELAPVLAESAPELREYLNSYLSEKSGEARKFAAVFLILKHPGMHPFIGSGPGRETPLNEIDDYRYNWWGSFKPDSKDIYRSRQTGPYISYLVRAPVTGSLDFLNETQKSMAKDEWQRLSRLDTAPNYLCSQIVNWAKRNPDDPRVPEALHLAVRSTRYGCVNEKTSSFSRQAFQLLHRQYPRSVWASKTKYWY